MQQAPRRPLLQLVNHGYCCCFRQAAPFVAPSSKGSGRCAQQGLAGGSGSSFRTPRMVPSCLGHRGLPGVFRVCRLSCRLSIVISIMRPDKKRMSVTVEQWTIRNGVSIRYRGGLVPRAGACRDLGFSVGRPRGRTGPPSLRKELKSSMVNRPRGASTATESKVAMGSVLSSPPSLVN